MGSPREKGRAATVLSRAYDHLHESDVREALDQMNRIAKGDGRYLLVDQGGSGRRLDIKRLDYA